MKRQILFALFIVFILSGYAQERIVKGHVLDESSKEGLDSALVAVFDTNIFVYTYKSGVFNINLPKRRRHLYISKEGYADKKIMIGPGFQHKQTRIYLQSVQHIHKVSKEKKEKDSVFLNYKNTLSLSMIELFAVAIAFRYERFVGKKHSIGAHFSYYINGKNPFKLGSEHDYYHEYQGFKLAPAYRYYPIRKNFKGVFIEAKIPFGYIHFSKLDYHSTHYTHLDIYKEYSTWIYGYSLCLGVSFYLPKTKHGIITFSFGYQNFPLEVPEEASKTFDNGVTLSFPTEMDWWYMPGPGSYFEMKFMIGGIF